MRSNHRFNTDSPKIKVVILEDDKFERQGMIADLGSADDIEVIGASAQPSQILAWVKEHCPDVAFIDLKTQGDINVGAATIREIKAISPEVKCIVLTSFPELPNFLVAFDAGAEGFLSKETPEGQLPSLAELVQIVVAGGRYYDANLVGEMRRYLDIKRLPFRRDRTGFVENPLTKREHDVLLELARRHTNAEIAAKLCITENTVRTHIGSINQKLGAKDRHEAVLIAMSMGWLNNADSE